MCVSLKITENSTLTSHSESYRFHWTLYLRDSLCSPSLTWKLSLKWKHSWCTIWYQFQEYCIVIWHLHVLWNDYRSNSSNHLSRSKYSITTFLMLLHSIPFVSILTRRSCGEPPDGSCRSKAAFLRVSREHAIHLCWACAHEWEESHIQPLQIVFQYGCTTLYLYQNLIRFFLVLNSVGLLNASYVHRDI